jgi:hypothetical protein
MSRLTYKDTKVSGGYNAVDTDEYACVVKLGKLEDLEEQLGCPLEVVITPYFKRGKLEVFYRGKMREVIRVVAFEEATRPYIDVFYRDNEKEQFKVRTIWLDDYKKTWWLKEDKSE